MNIHRLVYLFPLALAAGLAGCASTDPAPEVAEPAPPPDEPAPYEAAFAAADDLYDQGRYAEALVACIDIEEAWPQAPGLHRLRQRVLEARLEDRIQRAYERDKTGKEKMALDALEAADVPDSYKERRYVDGDEQSFLYGAGAMVEALDLPVTMHLQDADLVTILDALSSDTNLNVIADQDVGAGKKISVDVDAVPLREVLEYITRNMGVDFHVGQNILWVSTTGETSTAPLHTRLYHLHKGLQWHGNDWGPPAETQGAINDLAALANKATVIATNKTYIEDVLEKFITPVEGAQLHLDKNSHTLIVRNTWENLEIIGEILEAVDMNPPQVFIEARFIEVDVADLRELGIEWILDSPFVTSTKTFTQEGRRVDLTRTQIDEGDIVQFDPYTSDDAGPTPLGPQGAFGELRDGVPATAAQGLNFTYQGILTEPMFTAVLHALDISGKGRTLSVPRMTTINNNPAKLRDGTDLLYFDQFKAQPFSLLDENRRAFTVTVLNPEGKPILEELGITLIAVPSVGADRETINLMLTPTISKLEGFLSYQDVDRTNTFEEVQQVVVKLPIINRREIQTKVVVRSGDTVVMGGLIETVSQETVHKVPYLGEIPMLGRFFQRLDVTEQAKNLLIFVTATVLSERGESLIPVARPTRPPAIPSLVPPPPGEAEGELVLPR